MTFMLARTVRKLLWVFKETVNKIMKENAIIMKEN